MAVEGGAPYRQMLANRVSARQSAKRKRELAFSSPAPRRGPFAAQGTGIPPFRKRGESGTRGLTDFALEATGLPGAYRAFPGGPETTSRWDYLDAALLPTSIALAVLGGAGGSVAGPPGTVGGAAAGAAAGLGLRMGVRTGLKTAARAIDPGLELGASGIRRLPDVGRTLVDPARQADIAENIARSAGRVARAAGRIPPGGFGLIPATIGGISEGAAAAVRGIGPEVAEQVRQGVSGVRGAISFAEGEAPVYGQRPRGTAGPSALEKAEEGVRWKAPSVSNKGVSPTLYEAIMRRLDPRGDYAPNAEDIENWNEYGIPMELPKGITVQQANKIAREEGLPYRASDGSTRWEQDGVTYALADTASVTKQDFEKTAKEGAVKVTSIYNNPSPVLDGDSVDEILQFYGVQPIGTRGKDGNIRYRSLSDESFNEASRIYETDYGSVPLKVDPVTGEIIGAAHRDHPLSKTTHAYIDVIDLRKELDSYEDLGLSKEEIAKRLSVWRDQRTDELDMVLDPNNFIVLDPKSNMTKRGEHPLTVIEKFPEDMQVTTGAYRALFKDFEDRAPRLISDEYVRKTNEFNSQITGLQRDFEAAAIELQKAKKNPDQIERIQYFEELYDEKRRLFDEAINKFYYG